VPYDIIAILGGFFRRCYGVGGSPFVAILQQQ